MRARTGAAAALALAIGVLFAHAQPAPTKASAEDLSLFPSSLTMVAHEQRVVAVATRSGKSPARVEWTVSNPDIASVTGGGASAALAGRSAGRVLVTARVNGRTATAMVIVNDDDTLRLGTIRWSLSPIPGLVSRPLLEASRVDDKGADLFAIDVDPMKRFAVVRALRADGLLAWQRTVRGTPWTGDRFGGLLVRMGALDQPSRTLARFDRPGSKVAAWRYKARGDIDDFAETDDGTLFLSEQTHRRLSVRDEGSSVVVINGQTGVETGHFSLPVSTWQASGACGAKGTSARRASELGSLGEGTKGVVYAQLLVTRDTWTRVCEKGRPVAGRGRFRVSRELLLVRLTRQGMNVVRSLWRSDVQGVDSFDRLHALEDVAPGPVVELRSGELVALRTHVSLDSSGNLSGRMHLARISGAQVVKEVDRPVNITRNAKWRVLIDGNQDPWVYIADGVMLQAIDLAAATTLWTMETSALPFEAIANGNVAERRAVVANDASRNQVIELNERGTVLRAFPVRVDDPHIVVQGNDVLHGADPQTHAVIEVQEPEYVESEWYSAIDVDASFHDVRLRFADFLIETR